MRHVRITYREESATSLKDRITHEDWSILFEHLSRPTFPTAILLNYQIHADTIQPPGFLNSLLFGPHLRYVSLQLNGPKCDAKKLFDLLVSRSTRLETLRVSSDNKSVSKAPRIPCFNNQSCLVDLYAPTLFATPQTLAILAELPQLKCIRISVWEDDYRPWLVSRPAPGAHPFPALQRLSMHCTTTPWAAIFFSSLLAPRLKELFIFINFPRTEVVTPVHFRRLCAAIAAIPSATLEDITVKLGHDFPTTPPQPPTPRATGPAPYGPDVIAPLLRVGPALRRLVLLAQVDIHPDNAFLAAAARAWPALEELTLHEYPPDYMEKPPVPRAPTHAVPPRATLAALVPFALRCPHLAVLAVLVDATRVPRNPELLYALEAARTGPVRALGPPTTALECLDVGVSPIGGGATDPLRVGGFLAYVFPQVWRLGILQWAFGAHTHAWELADIAIARVTFMRCQESDRHRKRVRLREQQA